jgi:hypothetical protein
MTLRAAGRVLVAGIVVALAAGVGEASGLAPAWAVLAGVAVSVMGSPPVIHRGVTAVAGGAITLLALLLTPAAGSALGTAVTAGVLAVAGGLVHLRADGRAPAWALLLGGGTVLAGSQVADATTLPHLAPALAGLVVGLLPMQIAEVVAQVRRGRDREVADDRLTEGERRPDPAREAEEQDV